MAEVQNDLSGGEPMVPLAAGDPSPFPTLEPPPGAAPTNGSGILGNGAGDTTKLDMVLDIPVRLSVELGRTDIPIRVVVNEEKLGLRFIDVVSQAERVKRLR